MYIMGDNKAASCSIDGQIILWDLMVQKGRNPLTQLCTMQAPAAKGVGTSVGILKMLYSAQQNQLISLGLD